MKKIITLLLIASMVIAGGLMAFADEAVENDCVLSEDQAALMLEIKTVFLNEKVAEGVISSSDADGMLSELRTRANMESLRNLGFGQWIRNSEYAETHQDMMPQKNFESRGSLRKGLGRGQGHGRGSENGTMLRLQP